MSGTAPAIDPITAIASSLPSLGPALFEMAAKGQPIPWSPILSVGIGSIDAQHRVLLNYINQLSSAIICGQSTTTLIEIIDSLDSYARLHFRYEERLFVIHHWQEQESHERAHRHFERQLIAFQERLAAGDGTLTRDLLRFLIVWLAEHILVDDAAFGPHFQSCGVR